MDRLRPSARVPVQDRDGYTYWLASALSLRLLVLLRRIVIAVVLLSLGFGARARRLVAAMVLGQIFFFDRHLICHIPVGENPRRLPRAASASAYTEESDKIGNPVLGLLCRPSHMQCDRPTEVQCNTGCLAHSKARSVNSGRKVTPRAMSSVC